jgi:hypothetical protein
MQVFIVTGLDLGWDCIVGVYPGDTNYEELEKQFPEDSYVIFERFIEDFIPDKTF